MDIRREFACRAPYAVHFRERDLHQFEFCRRLAAEPGLNGRVLDIGCGGKLSVGMRPLHDRLASADLDGVDTSPEIASHPLLRHRWQAPFEQAPIPDGEYDLAYGYNVVEHIVASDPFFQKLRRVLKPGGVFWTLTPHGRHPFAWAVRATQALRLKQGVAERHANINHYPAYYRLNTARTVIASARRHGFARADFIYMPCVNWDTYFPTPWKFLPHLYDRLLGLHFKSSAVLLAYRLQ